MFQKRQTFLLVEDGGRLQRLSTTVKQPCVGKLRRFKRDRLQRRGGKNLICSAATFWKLYRKRGTNKQKIHQRQLFNISILSNISVLCNFCRALQTLQRHHLSILFRRHLPKCFFFFWFKLNCLEPFKAFQFTAETKKYILFEMGNYKQVFFFNGTMKMNSIHFILQAFLTLPFLGFVAAIFIPFMF